MDKVNLKERPIQRVLRHKHSMEYLSRNGWTRNVEEARTFQDSLEAARPSHEVIPVKFNVKRRSRGCGTG